MKGNDRVVRFGAAMLGLMVLGWVLTGQAAKPVLKGIPTDWTHHHLIFSEPASPELAELVRQDPRYLQQWYRRNAARTVPASLPFFPSLRVHRDWSQNLGSGGSVGAGNYPAKYSFSISTANCASASTPDFVVFSTGLQGGGGQASIVAFDNLYSGCGSTVPMVYWAYNTGGAIKTSPVFSAKGTQVAFVQTNGAGAASLVLLKWAASTTESVTSPGVPTSVSAATYPSCVAPCMTTFSLRDRSGVTTDDTTSSVFYYYQGDTLWAGDSRSWLHEFTPVFNGTATTPPAEVSTTTWPLQVNPGNPTALSSVVYDHISGNLFVGDYGGYFYRVAPSTGTVTASGWVDHGAGLVAGPVVDSSTGKIYVFSSSDGTTNCVGSPCTAVYQFAANFGSGTTGTKATVGTSKALTPSPLYEGAFDNAYETSANGTGNLYVCGNTGGTPALYQIPITAAAMGTVVAGPSLASAATQCSPVSDVPNPNATGGAAEWMFVSVQAGALSSSCAAGGCVMNFVDMTRKPSTAYVVGQEVLDTHFQIQVVRKAGTTKATALTWGTTVGANTVDGSVTWLDQGPVAATVAAWKAITAYTNGQEVLDSNNNVQLETRVGTFTSGAAAPAWNATVGGATNEGTTHPRWLNVGALATHGFASAGGASGIVIDNTVGSGTMAGASEVYFSTQSNQVCGTSGTGGCAVQASQSVLH